MAATITTAVKAALALRQAAHEWLWFIAKKFPTLWHCIVSKHFTHWCYFPSLALGCNGHRDWVAVSHVCDAIRTLLDSLGRSTSLYLAGHGPFMVIPLLANSWVDV